MHNRHWCFRLYFFTTFCPKRSFDVIKINGGTGCVHFIDHASAFGAYVQEGCRHVVWCIWATPKWFYQKIWAVVLCHRSSELWWYHRRSWPSSVENPLRLVTFCAHYEWGSAHQRTQEFWGDWGLKRQAARRAFLSRRSTARSGERRFRSSSWECGRRAAAGRRALRELQRTWNLYLRRWKCVQRYAAESLSPSSHNPEQHSTRWWQQRESESISQFMARSFHPRDSQATTQRPCKRLWYFCALFISSSPIALCHDWGIWGVWDVSRNIIRDVNKLI